MIKFSDWIIYHIVDVHLLDLTHNWHWHSPCAINECLTNETQERHHPLHIIEGHWLSLNVTYEGESCWPGFKQWLTHQLLVVWSGSMAPQGRKTAPSGHSALKSHLFALKTIITIICGCFFNYGHSGPPLKHNFHTLHSLFCLLAMSNCVCLWAIHAPQEKYDIFAILS